MTRQEQLNEGIKKLAVARNAMKDLQAIIQAGREDAKVSKDKRYPVLAQMDADCNSTLSFIEKICADSFKLEEGGDVTVMTGGGGK